MGKRGPSKKPTAIKLLEGTHETKRHGNPDLEPKPEIVIPDPPKYLGTEGLEVWHEFAPMLIPLGLLSNVDRHSFGQYCAAFDELMGAHKIIEIEGLTVKSSTGRKSAHPAVGIRDLAVKKIKQFGSMFGMSPADRSGMQVVAPPSGKKSRAEMLA